MSGMCIKNDIASSAVSSATSATPSGSTSGEASSTTSVSTSTGSMMPVPTGSYCGSFGFDQKCSTTAECGPGYVCDPAQQNATVTEGCAGLCRYVGPASTLRMSSIPYSFGESASKLMSSNMPHDQQHPVLPFLE